MSKVEKLEIIKNKPNQDVISVLEGLLEDAKSGLLIEVCGAGTSSDNCIFTFMSGQVKDKFAMYGAINLVAANYKDEHL